MLNKIARIRYQCRRGMLELDAILQPYFEQEFAALNERDQQTFERLLTCTDPELFSWFIGSQAPADPTLHDMVTRIKNTQLHSF